MGLQIICALCRLNVGKPVIDFHYVFIYEKLSTIMKKIYFVYIILIDKL